MASINIYNPKTGQWEKVVGGIPGKDGNPGADGKSAFQTAVDAGYTGSEAEFNVALKETPGHIQNKNNPHGVTPEQIKAVPISEVGKSVASLENGKVPEGQLPKISSISVYEATITTSWQDNSDTGAKEQIVSISGVTAKNTASVDHVFTGEKTSENIEKFVNEENQYLDFITNGFAETVEGGIKFTIFGEPNTIPIPIIAEVS